VMYANGRGVPRDDREAVKWYRLGADQGNSTAQRNLAWMYEKGLGVTLNKIAAYALYELSELEDSSSGNKGTASRIRLASALTKNAMHAAHLLRREMGKHKNLLAALDHFTVNVSALG